MKSTIRFQSQLLFRRSYKPTKLFRNRPAAKTNLVFRPTRAGPPLKSV
jgi:hypothetical protein